MQRDGSRRRLFGCHLARAVFADVVAQISIPVAISAKSKDASDITCSSGHCLKVVMKGMARTLFSLFAGNLAGI